MFNYFKFFFAQIIFVLKSFLKFKKFIKNNDVDAAYNLLHNHTKKSLNKVNINVNVIGEDRIPDEPVLFVINHASMLDSFILVSSVKKTTGCLISAEGLWSTLPIITTWLKFLNCVYIDRSNNRSSIKSIQESANTILSGNNMAVFAEGDLTWVKEPSSLVAPFRTGALKIAYKANCPIVPLVIKNSMQTYKGYEPIGPITSMDVEVEFLEPVYKHIEDTQLKTPLLGEEIRSNMISCIEDFNNKNKHS